MSNQPQDHVADEREILDRLEAVALAATQGPWEYGFTTVENQAEAVEICRQNIDTTAAPIPEFYEVFLSDGRRTALVGNGPNSAANAQFISTFGPTNVLALIRMALAAGAPAETPKPYGYAFWNPQDENGEGGAFLTDTPATDTPDWRGHVWQSRALYAAQPAPAPATDARTEALEEAALICEGKHHSWRWDDEPDSDSGPRACARAIRAAMLSANSPREAG